MRPHSANELVAPKIAIDARYIRPPITGIERHTVNLLGGIAALRTDHRLVVLARPDTPLPPVITECPALKIVQLAGSPYSLFNQLRLPRALRRLGVALLHSPDCFAPLAGRLLRVVTIHDLIPLLCRNMLQRTQKGRLAPLWGGWVKLQCRRADGVVAVSRNTASDLTGLLGIPASKIRVIYNGVDHRNPPGEASQARPAGRTGRRTILYVGRHAPYKNLVALVRSFLLVRQRLGSAVRLVVAGPLDARYPQAPQEAKRLGLADSVYFAGHAGDEELRQLYREASVFAFPSLYEGFGLPPLEAMSHGVPVVSSDRSAMPEVLGDAALLVDPQDERAFAEAMLQVLCDDKLARRLRQRGYARAQSFTCARQAKETLMLCDELLSRRASREAAGPQ